MLTLMIFFKFILLIIFNYLLFNLIKFQAYYYEDITTEEVCWVDMDEDEPEKTTVCNKFN